jgi:peptidoglycan/LPS O-acetylase OafA/YrhL
MRLEYETNGSVNLKRFWMRRALRVLPPFYAVALAATVLTFIFYPRGTVYAPSLVAQLLFYYNYYSLYEIPRGVPGLGVVWSLAVEEHFYLLFPLLYVAMQRSLVRRHQAWLLWGLCAAVLAWRCVLVFSMHLGTNRIYPTTDTRIDSILFGCALAVWNNPYIDRGAPTDSATVPNRWKYFYLPAAVAALFLCMKCKLLAFQNTASFTVQGMALTVLFIGAIQFYRWLPFRLLNWGPAIFIGSLSYTLYLVHDVLLRATARLFPHAHHWQRAMLALTASCAAALAIYILIEKPLASMRRTLRSTPKRTPDVGANTTASFFREGPPKIDGFF